MTRMLVKSLTGLSSLFDSASPPVPRPRWEIGVLLALVALGAFLRFWGLGAIGLHGDEETMAMPAMHIVEHGTPQLPSGMFYARAIGQLYLMAGSVQLFGESEWAFRFPSALCGVLLIWLAWLLGRRFLAPVWNLAFAAVVTLLPALIVMSQTARMYIFLLASLAACTIFIFRWERTGRTLDWLGALVFFLVALQFHTLAIFGAFVFLFPGLLRADWRRLMLGLGAFLVVLAGYVFFDYLTHSFYPVSLARTMQESAGNTLLVERGGILRALEYGPLLFALGIAIAVALATYVAQGVRHGVPRIVTGTLIFFALFCQLLPSYHLAVLLFVAALAVALRSTSSAGRHFLPVVAASLFLAFAHGAAIYLDGVSSMRKVLGAMAGLPSVWPFLRLGASSPIAFAAMVAGLLASVGLLVRRERVPPAWLFFLLAVWLPLLVMGLIKWDVAVRYTDFALLPMLLCAFAALQPLADARVRALPLRAAAASIMCVAVVNPVAFAGTWNAGYGIHPDHKGAAQFIRSVNPGPDDIVVAEDVLQQTYYLGGVDYWLMSRRASLKFCHVVEGRIVDFYTHTPLLGTGAELEALIARRDRGAIYVIGSGEEHRDGRDFPRSDGIQEVLRSGALEVVYTGRDGLTMIWKVDAPRAAARVAEQAER